MAMRPWSHAVGNTYIQLVKKAPLLFGLVYKIGLFVSKHISRSPVYYANSKMVKYLKAYLKEHPTDVIVMPHLYPAETLTYMKRHNIPLPPTVVVMTDYTCIPFWEETDCDYYVVPDPALMDSIVKRGLPKEKLLPFGIPVSQRFYQPISKEEARKELHLDPSLPYILVAGGSMGAGNLLCFTKELARSCKKEHIIVIAGTNKSSRQKLQKTFSESNTVTILGYTDQMPLYLRACDLVFTKPGGLTSTEAAVCGTPMVHTRPIPGSDSHPADQKRPKASPPPEPSPPDDSLPAGTHPPGCRREVIPIFKDPVDMLRNSNQAVLLFLIGKPQSSVIFY